MPSHSMDAYIWRSELGIPNPSENVKMLEDRRRFPITRKEAEYYLQQVTKTDYACEYGHFGCAAWENGPCSDEIASEFHLLEDE